MEPFVHLHVHSNFSFGDGAARVDEIVAAAADAGMPALAITDHDGLYGAVRFYTACKEAGIKPIVGVELNVEGVLEAARRRREGRVAEALRLAQHSWSRRAADEAEPDGATGAAGPDAPGVQGHAGGADPGVPTGPAAELDEESRAYDGPLRGQTAAPGYHLVLLAQDYEGWSNLCRIISAAHLEHPGEPPWARWETIREHADHLIALSGCRRGELGQAVRAALRDEPGARERARLVATAYAEVFGSGGAQGAADPQSADYFIELQHELLPDSSDYLRELQRLAGELQLPVVATNDVHYVAQSGAPLHDVLAAEAANQPLPNPLGRRNAELYLKSSAQMRRLFHCCPEAYANAGRIAARCNLDLGLGQLLFPAYPLPKGETAFSLLRRRCFKGAMERYRSLTPEVTARLEHELAIIGKLGFAEYFLAVHDIVEFAQSRGIYYSGRGSAGNSIVSYVLRVTDADPIAGDLLFERFLNPARREMPDVDIDFCSARRDEVIRFIYERFGRDKVAMVATVNTVHAPSAVRIVAKAFGFRPDEINRLSRKVPWGSAAKLGEMLAERPELEGHEFQQPHYHRLVDLAEQLSGFPTHLGTHLGGFILSRDPLTDRVPLQWAAKGVVVAQFDKDDVETLGLVKMDILALKMHSAIAEAVRRIAARTGERISPWDLPRDDPKVYKLLASARSVGVFQLESSGQRNLASRLRERDFEDVIAAISLFRPGPLQAEMIAPFIRRRHGREPVAVPHPTMERILRRTYGVIVYQEQVIEVAAAVAGFSLAEADMLRRAMTHERSMGEMDEIGRAFVEKAVARGTTREVAEEVFRQLRGFAAYGFNKAHAACFAIVCNASAWLKAHYPAEFYCGLLNNQPMGFYSPRVVLNDARRFGLAVLPLDINRSEEGFSVEPAAGGAAAPPPPAATAPPGPSSPPPLGLRVGLRHVKTMSSAALRSIVAARGDVPRDLLGRPSGTPAPDGRPYASLADFVERTRTSVEITENLVRVGAFDSLGVPREELLGLLPFYYDKRRQPTDENALRLSCDELPSLACLPAWSLEERVRAELDVLRLNVSAHPLTFLRDQLRALAVTPCDALATVPHGRRVRLAGVLERAQMPWIRSGHRTLFLTLEDETELCQVVVFNDVYLKYGRVLKEALYFYVEGVLQNDEEHGLAVVANRICDLRDVVGRDGEPMRKDGDGRGRAQKHRGARAHRRAPRPGTDTGAPRLPGADAAPAPQPAYPSGSPEDNRAGNQSRRLTLPIVEPRTRPGRTG